MNRVLSWARRLGVSVAWGVWEFQWVGWFVYFSVLFGFGCSVAIQYTCGYECFNCLSGIHVYIFGSKVYMYT